MSGAAAASSTYEERINYRDRYYHKLTMDNQAFILNDTHTHRSLSFYPGQLLLHVIEDNTAPMISIVVAVCKDHKSDSKAYVFDNIKGTFKADLKSLCYYRDIDDAVSNGSGNIFKDGDGYISKEDFDEQVFF